MSRNDQTPPTLRPLITLAALTFFAWFPLLSSMQLEAATPERVASITVQPGQTLWAIAEQAMGSPSTGTSIDGAVDSIMAMNHLRDVALTPGQRLLIPTPSSVHDTP